MRRRKKSDPVTCPFLREAQVGYCQTTSVRKLIPLAQSARSAEKCSSPEFVTCSVFRAQRAPDPDAASSGSCPFLRESLMQFCSAAPVAKLVPYSEALLSRCGNSGFRFCELYLSMAHPKAPQGALDGVALPPALSYSSNHMWLDVSEDGTCHAGIDAFLGHALGAAERISYVWLKGRHRPAAIITAGGIDFEVMFPNPMLLTGCNLYLRADPARLTAQPYTAGWLFEGVPEPETSDNLMQGDRARAWMEEEQRRINEHLQSAAQFSAADAQPVLADGGLFAPGLPRRLPREQMVTLFHEFFSPFASGRKEP